MTPTNVNPTNISSPPSRPVTTSSWWQSGVIQVLRQLQQGQLTLILPGGRTEIAGAPAEDGLAATIRIQDPRCFREIAMNGGLGAAEAYLQGLWSTNDLVSVMRVFCRNLDQFNRFDSGLARLGLSVARLIHWFSSNTVQGSRKNISAHYDLSNEFFELFLDPTLMYSSGLFEQPDHSMELASLNKLERICRKLSLAADDRVLEIGTGWGGFAIHAARDYGCHVTTTTISRNQFELATKRVAAAGLSHKVTVLLEDYRMLSGQYDKVVSIEMLEAVGHAFLPTYFAKCRDLLKPGGRLLVQSITMPDHRYDIYRRSVDFIQKYIFPGGHLPSVTAMQAAIAQRTNLQLVDAFQFPASYAMTLAAWRREFLTKLETVRQQGFDERFIRTWEYYLCYCEAAFTERAVSVGQFLWERPRFV